MLQDSEPSPPWHAFLLLLLVSWYLLTSGYHGAINEASGVMGGDFKFFYQAAQRLNAHESLYKFDPNGATYVYSPLLAIVLRSFAAHSVTTALKLWYCVNAVCILSSVALFARARGLTWRHAVPICLMLITAFRFWPTVMTLALGQTNLLLLVALCGLYHADARKKPAGMAAWIVFGALIKTWFLGLLLYPLLRRDVRTVILTGIGYAAGLILLFAIVGFDQVKLFIEMTRGYATQHMGQQIVSQSLAGFFALHLGKTGGHVEPFTSLPALSAALHYLSALLVLAALAFFALPYLKPTPTPDHPARPPVLLGLVSVSILLLLPYCQPEYFVLCLPLLWTLLLPLAFRPSAVLALLIYLAFTRGGPYYPPIASPFNHPPYSLLVSTEFFAAAALWLLGAGVLWTLQPSRRGAGSPVLFAADPHLSHA